jgi:hypothetical protein
MLDESSTQQGYAMTERLIAAFAIVAVLAGFGSGARADDVPNLVGTWKASAVAVKIGSNRYRPGESRDPTFASEPLELTFTITEQHDNRFVGKLRAGSYDETVIGAISPNGRSGVMLDDDGRHDFTIRDADAIDLCYAHSLPNNRVVSCHTLTRQK